MTGSPVQPSNTSTLSDEEWLAALIASVGSPTVDGISYPRFADDAIQAHFVGSANETALREAWGFWRFARTQAEAAGNPLHPGTKLMDFGCGWGRITRMFLRDIAPENILGLDPDASMIEGCEKWFAGSGVQFKQSDYVPPIPCEDGSLDLITAYSVFSHLPEYLATGYIRDFARALRPGGLVVATTHARRMIDFCEQLRTDPAHANTESTWHQYLKTMFTDVAKAKATYDSGGFLHEPYRSGDHVNEHYGDSLFALRYVIEQWGDILEPVAYSAPTNEVFQSVFVLRRK
jgi:ubiquinone/menaquinone biosynthesis C-methylase UbiE